MSQPDLVQSLYESTRRKVIEASALAAASLDAAFGRFVATCRDAEQRNRTSLRSQGPKRSEEVREDAIAGARMAFNSAVITITAAHAKTFNPGVPSGTPQLRRGRS
jgi:hypothetical protein